MCFIQVGFGAHINYQQLLSLDLTEENTVEYIGFGTSSGVPATFKIWTGWLTLYSMENSLSARGPFKKSISGFSPTVICMFAVSQKNKI